MRLLSGSCKGCTLVSDIRIARLRRLSNLIQLAARRSSTSIGLALPSITKSALGGVRTRISGDTPLPNFAPSRPG